MSTSGRASNRYAAIDQAITRKPRKFDRLKRSDGRPLATAEYYGCNTFSYELMAQKLTPSEISLLKEGAAGKLSLGKANKELFDKVAAAVQDWAISKGATHYCHWFHPQTGATAEKHDSFFSFADDGSPIDYFTGKQLIQSEPDASSFPSGGRRSTFEARGYTAWDSSSPMFLMETDNGLTLCIPSVFISYSGEALDKKAPLLRSIAAINKSSMETLKLLGHDNVDYVLATLGPEQEYFVVDQALYAQRPDLVLAGRTLLGRTPPKGQQMEDHYFGAIKSRVLSMMMEAEHELYKLGVPCKTRHNEVAPSQCEIAPIFEFANVAADHNQLVMEILRSAAKRHDLVVLFHEKPYSEMNGSGKHVNWSLADSTGSNLYNPGENPEENIRFLYFLTAAIKAVNDWGGLIRSSVASAGNDFRLGANEAPPAIMSVFLGETLSAVLERISGGGTYAQQAKEINLDLAKVPVISRDNTDRNRTSPFAFTGNKFEFRAVGASQSINIPATYLNATVADALNKMNDKLKAKSHGGKASNEQVLEVIKETYLETKKVCFEGNNYSGEWHKEAERRGLPNFKDTPSALKVLKDDSSKKLLTSLGIYAKEDEIDSRYNVLIERYIKTRLIELETLQELIATHVLPAATTQLQMLGETARSSKEILGTLPSGQKSAFEAVCKVNEALITQQNKLTTFINRVKAVHDEDKKAEAIGKEGMELLAEIRETSNELELLVDDKLWSLPKYREMINFI
jgi:glutamine synthetase